MSSKHFRTIHDFSRHGYDVELRCSCGHRAMLSGRAVVTRFHEMRWPIGLEGAAERFRCSVCGSLPQSIGPLARD
ncbi:hypothetical protein [Croceicoccus sp. YJ47]|uniref:hypothetical protein n=1 Tax=Croceicoccus sp. YJ47 TaxID=2798724 RepID=UPI001923844B|nr:hypothetical protein [Croceicoccus sp. YJ47]QQN73187.1 hypothetical protein JD971_09935 [Croceicoccus sp. YJ47]